MLATQMAESLSTSSEPSHFGTPTSCLDEALQHWQGDAAHWTLPPSPFWSGDMNEEGAPDGEFSEWKQVAFTVLLPPCRPPSFAHPAA